MMPQTTCRTSTKKKPLDREKSKHPERFRGGGKEKGSKMGSRKLPTREKDREKGPGRQMEGKKK